MVLGLKYICSCLWNSIKSWKNYLVVTFLTFFVFLPVVMIKNPHSPYGNLLPREDIKNRIQAYKSSNNERIIEAERSLSSLNINRFDRKNIEESGRVKLLVTVVTLSRNKYAHVSSTDGYQPRYLTQVLAKLLQLSTESYKYNLSLQLLVCDVDKKKHEELERLKSQVHIHTVHVKKTNKSSKVNTYETEKRDYVWCLNRSAVHDVDYILVLEDDALPHDNLLVKLSHLISYRLPLLQDKFGFIKLFHPSRLNGYITGDLNRLVEWFALSSLLEHIVTFLLHQYSPNSKHLSYTNRISIYIYMVALLFAIGRINVNWFRELSPFLYRLVPAPSCCAPALLYTQTSAKMMANFLDHMTCKQGFAKDTAMETFHLSTGLSSWFFEPKLFDHIGVHTTRRNELVDPYFAD